jgi:hypothetical protein
MRCPFDLVPTVGKQTALKYDRMFGSGAIVICGDDNEVTHYTPAKSTGQTKNQIPNNLIKGNSEPFYESALGITSRA